MQRSVVVPAGDGVEAGAGEEGVEGKDPLPSPEVSVAFTILHVSGAMESDPPVEAVRDLVEELARADVEHPDVAVSRESGWTLSAFVGGRLVWQSVAVSGSAGRGPVGFGENALAGILRRQPEASRRRAQGRQHKEPNAHRLLSPLTPTLEAVTTVEIPTEAAQRLQTEADRRGISIEALLAEIAAGLPGTTPATKRRKLAFAGVVASGGDKPARHADRWLAEGFGD